MMLKHHKLVWFCLVLRAPIGSLMPYKRIYLFETNRHGAILTLKSTNMSKSTKKRESVKRISQLSEINSHAAGIDVSDTEMMAAFPVTPEKLEIRSFGCFTQDLHLLARCLQQHGIETIAMESTGIYWVTLFLMLQEYGFEVVLVNAKHVKNVTGRKDDESDAEWLQKLHRFGLLSASFQPDSLTRQLRNIVRHRKNLVRTSSTYLNRIQKVFELMNIKLHTIISDIDGKTGIAIIEAILSGERDPEVLADLRDCRIKASREEIIKSLEGYWSSDHLFELQQCYTLFCAHKEMIRACDKEIEQGLIKIIASKNQGIIPDIPVLNRKVSSKTKVSFNLTSYLKVLIGVDVTEIDGINELTALTVLSETGTDMTKWGTEHHFTSWLGLAPNTKISGGKVISSKIMKKKHHAGQAFRAAAFGLSNSKGSIGTFYRRIRSRSGPAKANVASARKLAIIFYMMVSKQQEFNPLLLNKYQEKLKEKTIIQLKRKLAMLEAA